MGLLDWFRRKKIRKKLEEAVPVEEAEPERKKRKEDKPKRARRKSKA